MFECEKCGKYMASSKQLAKHRAVDCEYRLVFPKFDAVHTVPRSIGSAGNCDNFVCYDFEAMLEIMDLKTKKSDINRRHVPISFAIASGIAPVPVYVIKKDPAALIRVFYDMVVSLCRKIVQKFPGMKQVPVFGFNSQKYDMNLIMDSLIISVEAEKSHKINPCIRKGNNYMTLNIDVGDVVVSFRDIRNHLPPCNFDEFIQSFKCTTSKGFISLTTH